MGRHRFALRIVLLALVPASFSPAGAGAQAARVRTPENLRSEPNGEVLGKLEAGTPLTVVGRRERWSQVDVEGWVWARSLQVAERDGLDLVVSEAEGENLRAGPSGTVLGRLGRGTLLEELERRPGWIHVSRRAWIWSPSLVESAPAPPQPVPERDSPEPTGAGRPAVGYATLGAAGATILSAPGGDTVGRIAPRAEMEIVAREGSWARVRVEGWTWLPERDTAAAPAATGALTPAELRLEPAAHRGRVVAWELQFISLERAEKVRTDFFEGEPFLLTRYGGSDGPFVYVAVPAERTRELAGLVPLERISVTGRVRTGASSLTGTPIIDLVTLERVRKPR